MGNKSHATGLRLGINQNWKNIWYTPKNEYADTMLQDIKIRKLIEDKLKNAAVASQTIKRSMNKVLVEVRVARPGVVIGKGGGGIETLEKELKDLVNVPVQVKVFEVKRPEIEAKLVAEAVAAQCARRIAPKAAASRAIEQAWDTGAIKGIMITVGGRIRGAEIARVLKFEKGTVPKHTLRANIDYAFTEASVPGAGKHGIKVWINKGEKQDYEIDTN
jgi:small subunit ribosomal protein S3